MASDGDNGREPEGNLELDAKRLGNNAALCKEEKIKFRTWSKKEVNTKGRKIRI